MVERFIPVLESSDSPTIVNVSSSIGKLKGIATYWYIVGAIRMHAYINDKNREKHVVMVVHFGMVNLYKGRRGLSTSFDISRMFINTDIDEITSFKQSFIEKFLSSPSSSDNIGSCLISSDEDEFLNNTDFLLSVYLSIITQIMLVGTFTAIFLVNE
ncbi:hypothetical protein HanLR1_Chr09g0334321 [Helianthus annuus]|nr:hypothetical protein HanHA89_Chr09g0355021 [Helianthus annuus]KAJ0708896.1 hypothetical protein HanLR1_Chr09g0334321 [Helianthus annuus]